MILATAALSHLPVLQAAVGKPEVAVGWTPAATMGAVTNLILAVIGGGGLKVLANHFLQLRTIANNRAKQIDERADGYNDRLVERVDALENSRTEERKAHLEEIRNLNATHLAEITAERKDCDEKLEAMRDELREMRTRLDGFMRGMVQYQSSDVRTRPLSPEMRRAMESLDTIEANRGSEE